MLILQKQRGFTLIEIAIVLVIIGLLLGGILKGQELITSARVRNMADQNSGVQAAYYGFIDRYRQIPGDWDQALAAQAIPGVTTGGDGSGFIDADYTSEEPLAVWEHLQKAGFLAGSYNGGNAAPTVNETDKAPRNAFNGFLLLSRSDDYFDAGTAAARLNLVLGTNTPVAVARELDVKLDDGFPTTGVLRAAAAASALTPWGDGVADCVDTTPTPNIWNVAGASNQCNPVVLY